MSHMLPQLSLTTVTFSKHPPMYQTWLSKKIFCHLKSTENYWHRCETPL